MVPLSSSHSVPTHVNAHDQALVDRALPLIAETTGVDFGGYRLPMVSRRLRNHMLALGIDDQGQYVEQLRASRQIREAALERITIKVSRFFRNPASFEVLAQQLRGRTGPADVWVAGCGTGEEVWSLAMLLEATSIDARIVATDIDARSLAFAACGHYPVRVLADIPAAYASQLERRDHAGAAVVIPSRLRERVQFRRHDLTCEAPPVRDALLVSCRNVLIYFERPYQSAAQSSLLEALAPGGILFLGEAEWLVPSSIRTTKVVSATHRLFQRPASVLSP